MTELERAMVVAIYSWPGTSIFEGANDVLRQIYAPHEHVGDGLECHRCGKHRQDH